MTANRIHDLLPWFVNGTLEPAENASFEQHLMDCADCKKELEFLEKLKGELELHGDEFLAEHPAAEKLVALLGPGRGDDELGETEATELRRHLALCATCAEEARWLRGEATAGPAVPSLEPSPESSRTKFGARLWMAAAAVLVIAVALTPWLLRSEAELAPGVLRPWLLEEAVRGDAPVEIPIAPDAVHIFLIVPVDLEPDAFPAMLEIEDDNRRTAHREEIGSEDLYAERYLFVSVRSRDFPDGDYLARLASTRDASDLGTEYRFRVVTMPGR